MIRFNKKGYEEIVNVIFMIIFAVCFILMIIIFSIYENPFFRTSKTMDSFGEVELNKELVNFLNSEIEENVSVAYFIRTSDLQDLDEEKLMFYVNDYFSRKFMLPAMEGKQLDYNNYFIEITGDSKKFKYVRSYPPKYNLSYYEPRGRQIETQIIIPGTNENIIISLTASEDAW